MMCVALFMQFLYVCSVEFLSIGFHKILNELNLRIHF